MTSWGPKPATKLQGSHLVPAFPFPEPDEAGRTYRFWQLHGGLSVLEQDGKWFIADIHRRRLDKDCGQIKAVLTMLDYGRWA